MANVEEAVENRSGKENQGFRPLRFSWKFTGFAIAAAGFR